MSLVSAALQSYSETIKRFWVSDNWLNGGFGGGNDSAVFAYIQTVL